MKTMILKTLLLITTLFSFNYSAHAQDPRLVERFWDLTSAELNGEGLEVTPFPEFRTVALFNVEEWLISYPYCSHTEGGGISYENDDAFNLIGEAGGLIGDCVFDIMWDHLAIYYSDNGQIPNNPFSYTIDEVGDTLVLTIENGLGDHAVYTSDLLSVEDFERLNLSVFPNPTDGVFQIQCDNCGGSATIDIFDVLGKKVKSISVNTQEIDISELKLGIYFMLYKSDQGTAIQKIMKR